MSTYVCRATQLHPRWDLVLDDEPLSIDGEFIDALFSDGRKNGPLFARVAVTNTIGQTIIEISPTYDKEPGMRTRFPPKSAGDFGGGWPDLERKNGACDAIEVEEELLQLLANRPVIFHAAGGDMKAFHYVDGEAFFKKHCQVFDTQKMYAHLQPGGQPALKKCATVVLSKSVQIDGHTPVEDAQTAMELYLVKCPYDRSAAAARAQQPSFVPKAPITEYEGVFANLRAKKMTKPAFKPMKFNSKSNHNGSAKKKAAKAKKLMTSGLHNGTGTTSHSSMPAGHTSNNNFSLTINTKSVSNILNNSMPVGHAAGPIAKIQSAGLLASRGTAAMPSTANKTTVRKGDKIAAYEAAYAVEALKSKGKQA